MSPVAWRAMSPVELFYLVVKEEMQTDLEGGVFIGPADNAAQQAGCIQLMSAGLPQPERYLPLQWQRIQIRCVGPSLYMAENIAGLILRRIDNRNRIIVKQISNGFDYLVHSVTIESGPSMHFDSPSTWEVLLFAEILVGTQAIGFEDNLDPDSIEGGGGFGEGGWGTP